MNTLRFSGWVSFTYQIIPSSICMTKNHQLKNISTSDKNTTKPWYLPTPEYIHMADAIQQLK